MNAQAIAKNDITAASHGVPSVTQLPFVLERADGTKVLWAVRPEGDWSIDCATGAAFGEALIGHMQEADNPSILGLVAQAITERGVWSGVECGFFQRLSEAAIR